MAVDSPAERNYCYKEQRFSMQINATFKAKVFLQFSSSITYSWISGRYCDVESWSFFYSRHSQLLLVSDNI